MPFETDCKSEARMIIICPHCGKHHKLPEDWSANKVKCSRCGEKFFLDELASEFIASDDPQKETAHASSASSVSPTIHHLRLAIGIVAILVIAGAAVFYFLHVAPENRFRQAMREGQEAENSQRWDDALNAYGRADFIKQDDVAVVAAFERMLEKRRLAEYAEAMARGKAAEQSNNWEDALHQYQTALMRKADDADAVASVKQAQYQLHMKEGREAEQQKRWEVALIAYSHALSVKPSEAEAAGAMSRADYFAAVDRGQKAEALQKWEEALEGYRKALLLRPDDNETAAAIQRVSSRVHEPKPQVAAAPKKTKSPSDSDIKVSLEWQQSSVASPVAEQSAPPSKPDNAKMWLVYRVMEKSGAASISATVIPVMDKNAWAFARQYEANAKDPKKLYALLGQHLLMAEHLLGQTDLSLRRKGLAIAVQAANGAADQLKDPALAVAISDAFLLPNFEEVGHDRPSEWLSKVSVLEEAIVAYIKADDEVRQYAAYQLLLKLAPDRNTADFVRFKIAQLDTKAGRHEQALKFLNGIEPGKGGMSGVRRLMPGIERKLQLQNTNRGEKP
jgi:tetratricopeptide (TPR) repeat protein